MRRNARKFRLHCAKKTCDQWYHWSSSNACRPRPRAPGRITIVLTSCTNRFSLFESPCAFACDIFSPTFSETMQQLSRSTMDISYHIVLYFPYHMNRCIKKWKEANDSYKDHLEGQLILQFGGIVEPFYSEQIGEFDRS